MDRSTENPGEDHVSPKSNEKMLDNMNPTLGRLQSFRNSIRQVADKSPLSRGKRSQSTATVDSASTVLESTHLQAPPSPSLSCGYAVTSLVKNIGEDETDVPEKSKTLTHSKTDPNMAAFVDCLQKRGASIRRSLKLGGKKDKDKIHKQESLIPLSEGSSEVKKETEEEVVREEIEETYTLPEIPHSPLSVMQINKLIEMELLEEAHLNLLSLRQEFQQEQEQSSEDLPMEIAKKEKDLSLLYGDLRNKINGIVCNANSLPSRNKDLLVARIIQEEEKRVKEPGGLPGSWMEAWREAVYEGVQTKVQSVHLEQREQNSSWLAVHLGLLGKTIVEDLVNVKKDLCWSYPPSFRVFSTYVKGYHRAVGQHLKKQEQQVTELKDLYALLDWIINHYTSERIMGNLSLQPDMKDEDITLQLEDNFLEQLKEKYCCRVKEDMRTSLDKIIELENEELWRDRRTPDKEDDFLNSQFHMDLWTKVKGNAVNSKKIDAQLEQRVISSCLEQLKEFPKRFETEFRRYCSALKLQPLWAEYQITYINSFISLQQHMEEYQDTCPYQVEGFRQEVKWLIVRLTQGLEEQFNQEIKPYLRRMMTRKWLTIDDDFEQLYQRTKLLSQHCALMRPPHAQEFTSQLHYHLVKEYISQLMTNKYSCRNRKQEKAARKIRQQWRKLCELFEEMKSIHEWLNPVGDELSDIIGEKNKANIKNHLQPLVAHYPDFSRKHLVAVLNFRGLPRGREYQQILQRLTDLKKKLPGSAGDDKTRVLFNDMQVNVNTDCLSNLPFSCINFRLPDN